MNARRTKMWSFRASTHSDAAARHEAEEIPQPAQTLHADSQDSHTILNQLKSLDPVAQVLALHDGLIEHAQKDQTTTEVLASALLERAFEPGHAPARGDEPRTSASPSQHTSTSRADHPDSPSQERVAPAETSKPLSRQEQYRALREKYGLAEAHTGESLGQFWKNSTKSIGRLANAAMGAFGGASTAQREQARNLAREAIVGTWAMLPESVRKAATSAPGLDLGGACGRLLAMPGDSNGVHHAGACAWAVEKCEPRHVALMVPLLKSKATVARVAAERALFAMCYVLSTPRIPEWMTLALQGVRTGEDDEFAVLPDAAWAGWEWVNTLRHVDRKAAVQEVHRALTSALDSFDEHNSRSVLTSALVWLDPTLHGQLAGERSAWDVLRVDQHPAQSSLAGMLRTSRWPLTRLRALQWLGVSGLSSRVARACAARLSISHSPQDQEATLSAAHLCLRGTRSEMLSKVVARGARGATRAKHESHMAGISQDMLDRMTAQSKRMMGLWQSKIGVDAPLRERTLSVLLTDASPDVRLCVCRRGTSSLRHDLLFDRDERVARSALMAIADDLHVRTGSKTSTNSDAERSLRVLQLSAQEPLRAGAAREAQGVGDAFTDTAAGRLRAIRWLSENRTACLDALRDSLQRPSQKTTNSLRVVRLLRVASDVEESLLRLAILSEPAHARIAAMAVSLLATVRSEPTKRVLQSCLAHPDARVRANTIESLGRLDAPLLANAIVEIKHDKHHRVSANAMRESLVMTITGRGADTSGSAAHDSASQHAQGVEPKTISSISLAWRDDLASLLTNDSVMHRLAGVWLAARTLPLLHSRVDRIAWAESSQRIAEMADFDGDMRVRKRAAACAALVEGATKFQWRESVG